jgi:hypothetical protein
MRMSSEGDFNSDLAKELKKYRPQVFSVKSSDKYTAGISDFLLWGNGKSVGLEVKLSHQGLDDFNKPKKPMLVHTFSPGQMLFLRHIRATGNQAYGLVVCKPHKSMFLVDTPLINTTGNVSLEAILSCRCFGIDAAGVEGLLAYLFG